MIFLLLIPLLSSCHADLLLCTSGDTGDDATEDGQSEVLDVIRNLNCSAPPPFPVDGECFKSSGVSAPEGVMVCGGNDGGGDMPHPGSADCYTLSDNKWVKQRSMGTPRWDAASAYFPTGNWWVGGGMHNEKVLRSTELLNIEDGVWQDVSPLPLGLTDHCAEAVDNSTVFVTGGMVLNGSLVEQDLVINNNTFMMDIYTGKVEFLKPMRQPRTGHACTTLSDGSIMVVGGTAKSMLDHGKPLNSVEIFDPRTKIWTKGAPLPAGYMLPSLVNIAGLPGPLLLGGIKADSEGQGILEKSIFLYMDGLWTKIKSEALGRGGGVYLSIKEDGVACNPL